MIPAADVRRPGGPSQHAAALEAVGYARGGRAAGRAPFDPAPFGIATTPRRATMEQPITQGLPARPGMGCLSGLWTGGIIGSFSGTSDSPARSPAQKIFLQRGSRRLG